MTSHEGYWNKTALDSWEFAIASNYRRLREILGEHRQHFKRGFEGVEERIPEALETRFITAYAAVGIVVGGVFLVLVPEYLGSLAQPRRSQLQVHNLQEFRCCNILLRL